MVDVFISYRRQDAAGQATLLKKTLSERYGAEHVFMDVTEIAPGENFRKVIQDHVRRCDILLALIGPSWEAIMQERTKQRVLDHSEDYVRIELETALGRGSGVQVVPVLLDDAKMPLPLSLPKSLRRISETSAATLRHTRWDDDVEALIERLDQIADAIANPPAEPEPQPAVEVEPTPETAPSAPPAAASASEVPPPGPAHYEEVARFIARNNSVIPFLGSVVGDPENADEWSQLATHLAQEFDQPAPSDLAEISQYVLTTMGKADLYKALRKLVTASSTPGPVHKYFAALPAKLESLGAAQPYQLIVTTGYDDALEQAFDDANEPYDLAVYMAQGEHKGKFLHVPYDGDPQHIAVPNTYLDFPIDEDGDLERTIIMKVHGAVDSAERQHPWRENYVITENDYIDYLSRSPIESLVPLQLLTKLTESHFLFLGYRVRDWSLRVFLQRVWGDQRLSARSWAIGQRVNVVERDFWSVFGVDLFDVGLETYLAELDAQLTARAQASASQ